MLQRTDGEGERQTRFDPTHRPSVRCPRAARRRLHRREATGIGQYVDLAMAATLMAVNEGAALTGAE